jgi:hydrogenase large subunit
VCFKINKYVPDTLTIASFYKEWGAQGEGFGNFLCYGDLPKNGMDDSSSFMIPGGVFLIVTYPTVHPVDMDNEDEIQEFVSHSWYEYSGGKDKGLHPYNGETNLDYTGPKPPYKCLNVDESSSWLKSTRWRSKPMETGPLARVLMFYAKGHEQTK